MLLMLLILFAVSSLSFAAGPQGVHDPGTGIVSPETKESAQGTGQGMMQTTEETKASASQGIHEPGTGLTTPELKEAAQGTGQGLEAKAEEVVNETASAAKEQTGFGAALTLLGLVAASFGLLCRKH
jgi:hypothetical protein